MHVFLTNQSTTTYRLLGTLAKQQDPPKPINELTMEEITGFMENQFDPKLFVIRELHKYWSDMTRKPGETLQELGARIRQEALTCDFASIKDPQDEALCTKFMCAVGNEAVVKALLKISAEELMFAKVMEIALETEVAAKAAKETVHGDTPQDEPKEGTNRAERNWEVFTSISPGNMSVVW